MAVFSLFLAIPLASGVVKPFDIDQVWKKTGIDLLFVHSFISDDKCNSTPTYLESCKQAVLAARPYVSLKEVPATESYDLFLEQVQDLKSLKISKQLLYGKMLNAQLHVFDAHAALAPEEAWARLLGHQETLMFTLGFTVVRSDDGVRVAVVHPDSPASRAGIESFDRVISMNGKQIGTNADSARDFFNPALHEVDVELDHRGVTRNVHLIFAPIESRNVTSEKITLGDKSIALVRVEMFRENACKDIGRAISEMGDIQGVILDLRFNPGGRTDEAVCVAGLFLKRENVYAERAVPIAIPVNVPESAQEAADKSKLVWESTSDIAPYADLPLVVLINQLSASASEIVAGAIQDHKRGYVVGLRSFGKGSVQTVRMYPDNDNFRISFTSALFYRPNGNTNELQGVTPDFIVPFREGATLAELSILREKNLNPGALLPPEEVPEWVEPRADEVAKVESCIDSADYDDSGDYQRDFAAQVLRCQAPAPSGKIALQDQRPE